MEERKIVELKMKFYEDELDDFLAMIYIMKSELDDHNIDMTHPFVQDDDDVDKFVKCDNFEYGSKPFLKFLHWFAGNFYVKSLDDENYSKKKKWRQKLDAEKCQEAFDFLERGKVIRKVFSKKQITHLARQICSIRRIYQPKTKEKDIFLEAVRKFEGISVAPSDLNLFYTPKITIDDNFRRDVRVSYNKKMSRKEKYVLARVIFEHLQCAIIQTIKNENHTNFEQYNKIDFPLNDYQLYILTGFVLSEFKFETEKIKTEEEHLERSKTGYIKPYRDYLASMAGNWVKNGDENIYGVHREIKHTPIN